MGMPTEEQVETTADALLSRRHFFDSRIDIGLQSGLIRRMLAAFMGNPIAYRTHTSASSSAPSGLDNINGMQTAILYVSGSDIIYRVDGATPAAAGDQTIRNGSTVTLTGEATILGFQFAASGVSTATVFVTYYD